MARAAQVSRLTTRSPGKRPKPIIVVSGQRAGRNEQCAIGRLRAVYPFRRASRL